MGRREEGEGRAVCMGAGLHSGGTRAPNPAVFVWMACLLNKKDEEKVKTCI